MDACTRYASDALSREERENARVRASSTCHAVCSTPTERPSLDSAVSPATLAHNLHDWGSAYMSGVVDCDEL